MVGGGKGREGKRGRREEGGEKGKNLGGFFFLCKIYLLYLDVHMYIPITQQPTKQ